jgi:hypothetical protein
MTPSKPGWVYILTNEAMPGMVKIGLTTKTPKERAAELSSATGVPLPFVVAWARAVSDCDYVERVVHRMLDDRRVNEKRESFRVDVATARQVIEAGAGSMLGRSYRAGPVPLRRNGRRKGRGRRRSRDLTGFGLAVSGVVMVAALALFKPTLPGWLPGPVLNAFQAVERLPG